MTNPWIDQLVPNQVAVNSTSDVTITGSNFTANSQAKFDGTPVVTTYVSATKITARVDQSITAAPATLAVRVFNSETEISNDVDFTITGAALVATVVAAPDAGFGILSSIKYRGTNVEKLFNLGTARPAWAKAWQEGKGYNGTDLRHAVETLCNNPQVGVIVTFGGNVAALAAANYSTVPFLSIFGNFTPQFYTAAQVNNLCGGVNLDTTARNADRFNYLNQELNIPAKEICLLSNPNSGMAAAEQEQWSALYQAGRIIPAYDLQTIQGAFVDFENDGTLTTMIVSADPQFQEFKQQLIIAANNSGKQVSYPLQVYSNLAGTARPAPGRHWLHGPKLARACFQLGRDAAEVLKDPDHKKLELRVPPMLLNSNNDES
jgi:hypothetical protein